MPPRENLAGPRASFIYCYGAGVIALVEGHLDELILEDNGRRASEIIIDGRIYKCDQCDDPNVVYIVSDEQKALQNYYKERFASYTR